MGQIFLVAGIFFCQEFLEQGRYTGEDVGSLFGVLLLFTTGSAQFFIKFLFQPKIIAIQFLEWGVNAYGYHLEVLAAPGKVILLNSILDNIDAWLFLWECLWWVVMLFIGRLVQGWVFVVVEVSLVLWIKIQSVSILKVLVLPTGLCFAPVAFLPEWEV